MCGIAGVFNLDAMTVSPNLIQSMTNSIRHRGPDGEGHFVYQNAGIGHRRLAIIDLSPKGQQPMGNENGNVMITYNGELYNFKDLRFELESHGHQFRSQSDTEVIIHAYEEWGEKCVEKFNGMFAFAILDMRKCSEGALPKMFLARDRFGIKPLYYYIDNEKIVFASEIKAILAYPDVNKKVCYAALDEYFTFQNTLTDCTLFDGIKLLPNAGTLVIDINSSIPIKNHQYWDFQTNETLKISFEEASSELYRLFTQAVKRQLISDVPIASYLSGGMDSGSITAVARQQLGRMFTFTGGFDLTSASGLELGFDERQNSEVLANLLKTEHYEIVMHAGDMEHAMSDIIWHLEDLRLGQCYPTYYVSRLAGKFVKVVLSGAGGDELFGGYPWRYYRGVQSENEEQYYQNYYSFWQRLVPDEHKKRLFNHYAYTKIKNHSSFNAFKHVFSSYQRPLNNAEDYVNASLYFELKTFLQGLFVVEDKMSMAHSLETRVPFLDNDMVDFALRLPAAYKLKDLDKILKNINENDPGKRIRNEIQTRDGKRILRQAMSRIIPADTITRTKQGFSAPDATWFRGESIDYINKFLRDRQARIYSYIEPSYVNEILDEHCSQKHNHRLLIWSLLSFEWWLKLFF